jgi:hypothetical protein
MCTTLVIMCVCMCVCARACVFLCVCVCMCDEFKVQVPCRLNVVRFGCGPHNPGKASSSVVTPVKATRKVTL